MQVTGNNETDFNKIKKRLELAGIQPVLDLLARVPDKNINSIIDMGCGTGFSTEILQGHFPAASISGIDKSAAAIEEARKRMPHVPFTVADISNREDSRQYDLIFLNAVLQLVPEHAAVLSELIGQLTPNGTLAIQMPDNADAPMQTILRTISTEGAWAHKIDPVVQQMAVESADWYYQQLRDKVTHLQVWRTTYYFSPASPVELSEWYRGTDLRLYLDPLDKEEQLEFLRKFQAMGDPLVKEALLPFSRLFLVATRT